MDSRGGTHDDDVEEGFTDYYPSEGQAPPCYASTRPQPPPYRPSYQTSLASHPVASAPDSSSLSPSSDNTPQDWSSDPNPPSSSNNPNLPPTAENDITSPPPSYHPPSVRHRTITSSPPPPNHPPPSYATHQQQQASPSPIPISPLPPHSHSSSLYTTNLSPKAQTSSTTRSHESFTDSIWCGSCFWIAPPVELGHDCLSDQENVTASGRERESEGWSQGWASWNNQYAFYIL